MESIVQVYRQALEWSKNAEWYIKKFELNRVKSTIARQTSLMFTGYAEYAMSCHCSQVRQSLHVKDSKLQEDWNKSSQSHKSAKRQPRSDNGQYWLLTALEIEKSVYSQLTWVLQAKTTKFQKGVKKPKKNKKSKKKDQEPLVQLCLFCLTVCGIHANLPLSLQHCLYVSL